ncbi:putative histone deacetylase [Helianthus annuus]|nr:putative histone deacetylase [Helianthus annuus]KAJ0883072.1 putative histone deacetylase [Helianthus annuus]
MCHVTVAWRWRLYYSKCCWCYETGVALGVELEDKMPQHEYFGPDYTLHVAPSNMENKKSRQLLDEIRSKLLQ